MARQHAAQRFEAPNTILQDVPLKGIFNRDLIRLIGESFLSVLPAFDRQKFQRRDNDGLQYPEFSQRVRHIRLACRAIASAVCQSVSSVASVTRPGVVANRRQWVGSFLISASCLRDHRMWTGRLRKWNARPLRTHQTLFGGTQHPAVSRKVSR